MAENPAVEPRTGSGLGKQQSALPPTHSIRFYPPRMVFPGSIYAYALEFFTIGARDIFHKASKKEKTMSFHVFFFVLEMTWFWF
ncbi:MAG: hypothetical protein ACI4L5_02480 [Negativibacillus sp.]